MKNTTFATRETMVNANTANANKKSPKQDNEFANSCPLGGDTENDCLDCVYSGDYHFHNGECVRR